MCQPISLDTRTASRTSSGLTSLSRALELGGHLQVGEHLLSKTFVRHCENAWLSASSSVGAYETWSWRLIGFPSPPPRRNASATRLYF
jgi:hypothetical protein